METINESDIESFKHHLLARGRQPATVESYGRDSLTFLEYLQDTGLPIGDVCGDTLIHFQEVLRSRGIHDNSLRRTVIGVRQFYRYLQDTRSWEQSPLDNSVIPDRHEKFNLRLPIDIIETLLKIAEQESSQLKGHRDSCIIKLLGLEGLKATELIDLEWRDFLYASDGGRLRVRGARARTMHLEVSTSFALTKYRQAYREITTIGGNINTTGKIMIGFKGTDAKHWELGLTRHGVKFALYDLGNAVGINKLNSEELRHFAIGHKVALGFTPEMLMNHLGLRTLGNISKHLRIRP